MKSSKNPTVGARANFGDALTNIQMRAGRAATAEADRQRSALKDIRDIACRALDVGSADAVLTPFAPGWIEAARSVIAAYDDGEFSILDAKIADLQAAIYRAEVRK